MQSDQKLIEQIHKRNATAFETLFDRYKKALHRHITRTVRDESAAEDLVQ